MMSQALILKIHCMLSANQKTDSSMYGDMHYFYIDYFD